MSSGDLVNRDRGFEGGEPEYIISTEIELSVVIPFRDDPALPHLMGRLHDQMKSFPDDRRLEFILVDSGSPDESATICRLWCEECNVKYIRHGKLGEVFSIGAARDVGAQHARGRALTFFDIDWRVSEDFWGRLLTFMRVYGISRRKTAFFSVPALYLTEDGTKEFEALSDDDKFLQFHLRWLRGDTASIVTMAPCSSIMVVDRLHYLSLGGHRPEFRGHGFEDFEVFHRLLAEDGQLPRPTNYLRENKNWDGSAYDGFRSMFSVIGRPALMAHLFVVHLWHPRPKMAAFYNQAAMKTNRELWRELFVEYDETRRHPVPLPSIPAWEHVTLYLGQPRSNAAECIRDVQPFLGEMKYLSEVSFVEKGGVFLKEDFEEAIRELGVTRILFHAPYGNEARMKVYAWCRETGFPYLVFERGALPDSWFFDPNGFNADSSSYAEPNWNRPLSTQETQDTEQFVRETLYLSRSLEEQGARIGGEALASNLGIGGRKVLFVPLQRPSDVVIKYMAGQDGYARFLAMIDEAAGLLKRRGWVVLCKRHPLETVSPQLKNVQFVPEDTHFLDLLELADAVSVINSGVGVYAMLMEKPCFICGDAFYQFDGLNVRIDDYSVAQLVNSVLGETAFDRDRMLKFIHHLRNDVYSFGIPLTESRAAPDGSLRTITTGVKFYRIKLPNCAPINYEYPEVRNISLNAPLFERFKLDILQRKLSGSVAPGVGTPKVAPVIAPKEEVQKVPAAVPASPATPRAAGRAERVLPVRAPKAPAPAPVAKPVVVSNDPAVVFEEGKRAYHRRRYAEAAQQFERLTRMKPGDAVAHRAAAEAYDLAGMIADARRHIQEAGKLLPKNPHVKQRAEDLQKDVTARAGLKPKRFGIPRPKA